jgi:predicted dinucleotide-binding enzyme
VSAADNSNSTGDSRKMSRTSRRGPTSSDAQALARKAGNRPIVCAFNTVPGVVLFGVCVARKSQRCSLAYYGDDAPGKEVAAALIRDVGFQPVEAGSLRIARYTEPFA